MVEAYDGKIMEDKLMREQASPVLFEDEAPPESPLDRAAMIINDTLASAITKCREQGVEEEMALSLAIASCLSAFAHSHGQKAALGFIGETLKFIDHTMEFFGREIVGSAKGDLDSIDGPGVIARFDFAPIMTRSGEFYMKTQCIVKSLSGELFFMNIAENDTYMSPIDRAGAIDWIVKHCDSQESAKILQNIVR